nr:hypothetical protein GCM10020093_038960 [Planobispora longispora]
MTALNRSSASPEIHGIIRDRVNSAIMEPLAALLPGEDAQLRAAVATALITGTGTLRQLFTPEELGSPSHDAVVARLTRIFEVCLEV